jgi:hypothetical protein
MQAAKIQKSHATENSFEEMAPSAPNRAPPAPPISGPSEISDEGAEEISEQPIPESISGDEFLDLPTPEIVDASEAEFFKPELVEASSPVTTTPVLNPHRASLLAETATSARSSTPESFTLSRSSSAATEKAIPPQNYGDSVSPKKAVEPPEHSQLDRRVRATRSPSIPEHSISEIHDEESADSLDEDSGMVVRRASVEVFNRAQVCISLSITLPTVG